jgi:hypothetical protein
MWIIWWNGWEKTYIDTKKSLAQYKNHETWKWWYALLRPDLLTTEFSFLALTLMMGVAMISIIRPMPIGWDDLGVYMNYPKILALTGESINGIGLYTWQLITGTGFLFSYNAAQAFFINQLWSILAVIAIGLGLSVMLGNKNKTIFISLPILLATVYYVMPMTVFHHTKDMKLDPALLFVSITALMMFFTFIKKEQEKKEYYTILAIIGILIGFAFGIKLTSLMLFLGISGVLAYRMVSFWGYLGFFFTFLAVFTGGNLWPIMNVWMPADYWILQSISIGLWIIWIIFYVLAYLSNSKLFIKYIWWNCILVLAFFIGISPWIVKNTIEVKPWNNAGNIETKQLIFSSVLWGSGSYFQADFTKIMSAEEYATKSAKLKESNINCDGKSWNEDFWRYFWYESWINNYLRLPLNLTFQKNQSWEFTSITYIFLALIPVLFLFARPRYPWIYKGIISISILVLFAYGFMWPTKWNDDIERYPIQSMLERTYAQIVSNETYRLQARTTHGNIWTEIGEGIRIVGTYMSDMGNILIKKPILEWLYSIKAGEYITNIFWLKECNINSNILSEKYPLLTGYLILIFINIFFMGVVHFLTRNDREDENFREMTIMLGTYGFIFLISAFWIVWYWILVYFIFFALIGLLSNSFNRLEETDSQNKNLVTTKWLLALFLFVCIWLYIVKTAVPHAWTNLRSAWSAANEYKYHILDQEEALFSYRSDYFIPIATLNLRDTQVLTGAINIVSSEKLKNILISLASDKSTFLEWLSQIIPQAQKSKDPVLRKDAHALAEYVYKTVLYPTKEQENTWAIYRIGTFMTYLIHKNTTRYYEDSLIFWFNTFFYEENPEKTIEKMKTLGLKFLLIDLNAATIDRDPKRLLTQRYEQLLLTTRARNLKLVSTDNFCLKLALDEYKNGKLQTTEDFLNIAGTNYESYRENEAGNTVTINRWQKQKQCLNYILTSIYKENGAERYPYLRAIKESIDANDWLNNPELLNRILGGYVGQSFFALYEITE